MAARDLRVAFASDPGRERSNNEDLPFCYTELGAFGVIDGVGGENAGEEAALVARDCLHGRLSYPTSSTEARLREAITSANNAIFDEAQRDPAKRGMSCVLTVAVVEGETLTIGHVGDSRAYLLTPGAISQLTRDHSPVGEEEASGLLTEAAAMADPRRSGIDRDVGSDPHQPADPGFIDIYHKTFPRRAALLFCSDGLSDMVPREQVRQIVEQYAADPPGTVYALIGAANEAGGKDNITAVLVVGEDYVAGLRPLKPKRAVKQQASTSPPVDPWTGNQQAIPPAHQPTQPRAQSVPGGLGSWFRGQGEALGAHLKLWGKIAIGLAVLALLLRLLVWLVPDFLGQLRAPVAEQSAVLRVSARGAGHYRTISEAMAAAQAGTTILVEPGDYIDRIELKDGVRVVSQATRRAKLTATAPGAGKQAVVFVGENVENGRVEGFVIRGDDNHELDIGVSLSSSSVDLVDLEISGAKAAAIQIASGGAFAVQGCLLRDNPGHALLISGPTTQWITDNLILKNGGAGRTGAPAAVEIKGATFPRLTGNHFQGNGGEAVQGLDASAKGEFDRRNSVEPRPRSGGGGP